jgi:tetratricopeptide (TPR) repeat protein
MRGVRWVRSTCRTLLPVFIVLALPAGAKAAQDAEQPTNLTVVAREYEQAGDRLKAAETYEQIVKGDPAKSVVLARRIATIYAESGQTNKAIEWAKVVMKTNPEPQAYLAGIHALLGNYPEAIRIVDEEIVREKDARRGIMLRWQLAGLCEKTGDVKKAEKLLREGVEISRGRQEEADARKRLDLFSMGHADLSKKVE